MEKNNHFLFDEDRGVGNQRSTQTKSSRSTDLTKKEDANNSICKKCEKLLTYFVVNGYRLNRKGQVVNLLLQQIQTGLNVIVISLSFFKND
jgi:hypothetical protein